MGSNTPKVEIRRQTPGGRRRIILLWLLLLVVAVALFQLGQLFATGQQYQLQPQLEGLIEERDSLKQRESELEAQVALLQRGRQIDGIATEEAKLQIRELQQEMLELGEEIAFYRGIVAPNEAKTGLRIQRFELLPLTEDKLFHYRLVLTQVLKNNQVTQGGVEVTLQGVEQGMPKDYQLEDVVAQPFKDLKFRFKYFQKFEGDILLPESFVPHSVEVRVKPAKARNPIVESFDWPDDSAGV